MILRHVKSTLHSAKQRRDASSFPTRQKFGSVFTSLSKECHDSNRLNLIAQIAKARAGKSSNATERDSPRAANAELRELFGNRIWFKTEYEHEAQVQNASEEAPANAQSTEAVASKQPGLSEALHAPTPRRGQKQASTALKQRATKVGNKPMRHEKDLQAQVLDHLAIKRVFHWRSNTGAMPQQNKSGKKRFVRFGVQGVPDILGCWKGRMFGIECKSDFGEQSQAQRQFQVNLEAAGGLYLLCYSLEDVTVVIR